VRRCCLRFSFFFSVDMISGDMIIDAGNEWYTNTERRGTALAKKVTFLLSFCLLSSCYCGPCVFVS
jgi:hypothetical protein